MFDNKNPYTLWTEESGSITRYFVSFKDGQAIKREAEISQSVYLAFCQFVKTERNLRHWDERHKEYSELSDETLNNRAKYTPKSVEDVIVDMERSDILRKAVMELPEIQRRRFFLYYEHGHTYTTIGKMEGCCATAVRSSVEIARAKVKKKLSEV